MPRPQAIYASIPIDDPVAPNWDTITGTAPVEYSQPYEHWPDLDWSGNTLDDSSPTNYGLEHPKYLWANPVVQDPVNGESYVFVRKWLVGNPDDTFTSQSIPAKDLLFIISLAADNQYAMALTIGDAETGNTQTPLGSNTSTPSYEFAWRNVKTFVFHVDLTKVAPGTTVNLITEAINSPQYPHGVAASNPAMFTWSMQVYHY